MLRTDRIAVWILIGAFALIIPSIQFLKFSDELACLLLGVIAVAQCVIEGRWRMFSLLWAIIGIFAFYLLYTLIFCRFNTAGAVCADFLIELKPYVPFAVMLGLAPAFTTVELVVLKWLAVVNASAATVIMLTGLTEPVIHHLLYGGGVIFVSMLVYVFACSTLDGGRLTRRSLITATVMLLCGLACTRSKYYGEAVVALFFLWIYRPGMLRHIGLRQIATVGAVLALVAAVSWSKFDFYFITGASEGLDRDSVQSFARPALYATALLIMASYLPFGSGLASFASFYSIHPYSKLYFQYGLNRIYGLSPHNSEFVCDAFYPSLAQFGVAGVGLFVVFWIKVAAMLRRLVRSDSLRFRYPFAVGSLIIVFIMIENIASTLFTQTIGLSAMCLLGIICGQSPSRDASLPVNPQTPIII